MAAPQIIEVARRTHNYLRLSLVCLVAVLLVAVAVESIRLGTLLPTISHYYYTPARNVLVGALVAASVALVALSGRNIESVLLDIAAPLAPLIALVPTRIGPGDIPGVAVDCDRPCVPPAAAVEAGSGILVYLLALAAVLLVGAILWRRDGPPRRPGVGIALLAGLLVGFGSAVSIVVGDPPFLLDGAHFAAAGLFVALFAAVPLVNVFFRTSERAPSRAERIVYLAVAAALLISLALGGYGVLVHDVTWPAIFWAEALALVAFAVFWLVQTLARWDERDPPSIAPRLARNATDAPPRPTPRRG